MPWWCLGCGRRMGSPVCKKKCREAMDEVAPGRFVERGNIGGEMVPPLDGFVIFEVDPDRPEAADMADRAAWFESKREKERRARRGQKLR